MNIKALHIFMKVTRGRKSPFSVCLTAAVLSFMTFLMLYTHIYDSLVPAFILSALLAVIATTLCAFFLIARQL